jgi:AcrR family transcriptional regulator
MSDNDYTAPNHDGTEPLDNPADEAIAHFFAAPQQFRQFKTVSALAEHLGLSRMTVYRRAKESDVVLRIESLVRQNMRVADLIVCRAWPGIVEAQVSQALAGNIRAAKFCQERAWRPSPIFPAAAPAPAIGSADAIAMWQEKIDESQAEELDASKEDPGTEQDENGQA